MLWDASNRTVWFAVGAVGVKVKTGVRFAGTTMMPRGTSRKEANLIAELLKSLPIGVTAMSTIVNASAETGGDGGAV